MDVSVYTKGCYGRFCGFGLRKNKPNSKPNKANFITDKASKNKNIRDFSGFGQPESLNFLDGFDILDTGYQMLDARLESRIKKRESKIF